MTTSNNKPRLALRMIDEQAVRRFCDSVGHGKVYGPYGPYGSSMGNQPHFDWVALRDEAAVVARLLLPWLGPRVSARIAEVFPDEVRPLRLVGRQM